MSCFTDAIKNRRSIYKLTKHLPVTEDKVIDLIKNMLLYVPDAFNMQSQRVVVIMGGKNDDFWDMVYNKINEISDGGLSRQRIDSFAAGVGTILYFYDVAPVNETRAKYPMYSGHFHDWVMQSNGMLQFAIWAGLREMGIGASLQHYNPAIDERVQKMFGLPESWVLVAQMPFGGIGNIPTVREMQDVDTRIKIEK